MSRHVILVMIGLSLVLGNLGYSLISDDPNTKRGVEDWPWPGGYYLKPMKEPSLGELSRKDYSATAYRFLWLPSFHDAISVRLVKSGDGAILHTVRLTIKNGYEPDKIIAAKSVKMSSGQWQRIARQAEKAKFWEMSSHERARPGDPEIMDGDLLIVEGVRNGKYHWVLRHSPPGGDFVDLCRDMCFMSGLEVRKYWFEYRR